MLDEVSRTRGSLAAEKASTEGSVVLSLEDEDGRIEVTRMPDGAHRVRAVPSEAASFDLNSPQTTRYPTELIRKIFEAFGSLYTCQEIGRDTDETDAALDVRFSIGAYMDDAWMRRPMRVLDYGCGSGSSSMTLTRLLENAELVGMDYVPAFIEIARSRAEFYGEADRARFAVVDASGRSSIPEGHRFDAVFLNAVYEHLLPSERPVVLREIWMALEPGGLLFVNQTPHRWFPIESHTTGLPGINYLPRSLAHRATRRYCRRVVRDYTWNELLRAGIRGATAREIMHHVRSVDPRAEMLKPIRIASCWPAVWYAAKRHRMRSLGASKHVFELACKVVETTGLPITPYLTLAIRKGGDTT